MFGFPIPEPTLCFHSSLLAKLDNDIPTNCTRLSVVSVMDVVRGAGTVCTFERKQLRRAAERHRTGGGLSKVAGRIKAQWSSCNWVIFGQVDHWKSLKLCRGRWLCQLWSPFKSSGSTLWKRYGGHLNSVLPSRISRLHCPHIFSSIFFCLKILRNFPEANMGVSPMKRREASEVKVRRVTTGRAKRAFRQILIYQYNMLYTYIIDIIEGEECH